MVVSSGFCHRKQQHQSNFKLSFKTPKQRNSFSEIRQCKKYPGKPKGPILICSSCLLSNDLSLIGGGAENKAGRRGHLEQMMGELENTKPLKTIESLRGDHVSSQSNLHGLWKRFPCLNWRQNFQVYGLCLLFTHSWRLHKAFIIYYIHNLPFSLVI